MKGALVLVDLLDPAGELVCGLRPVVVFHRDDKHGFDFLGAEAACSQKRARTQKTGGRRQMHFYFLQAVIREPA